MGFFLAGPAGGRELASAEQSAVLGSLNQSSYTALSGLAITFTVVKRPVSVDFYSPEVLIAAADTIAMTRLYDGTNVWAETTNYWGVAFAQNALSMRRVIRVPGTYTITAQYKRSAGTGNIQYGLTNAGPITLTATELAT